MSFVPINHLSPNMW